MAACKEACNQLKEQLTQEVSQGEELRRQLQDRQHELDEAHMTIAAQQQAEHRHTAELKAVKAEVQNERQMRAELQGRVDFARSEAHEEQQRSQAQMKQASPQPVQSMLHLVSGLLDAVIIPAVVTCLTQTWLLKVFALSPICMVFAVSHACMACRYQARGPNSLNQLHAIS